MSALVELERNFVLESWAQRLRPDKRLFQQLRDVTIEFPFEDRGICLVKIGKTIVMAAVACELVEPSPFGGGKNGFLDFSVRDATPSFGNGSAGEGGVVVSMASSTKGGRQSGSVIEITRLLETVIKGAKVIDVEALCVVPGKYVWSLRVDVTILNQEGNVTDAAVWSTIAALQHFRRPEVSVLPGNRVVVHQPHERDPIPLNMHHFPITITAAIVPPSIAASSSAGLAAATITTSSAAADDEDDDSASGPSTFVVDFVIDPSVPELAASAGVVIVALNHELQLCDIHKEGAVAVPFQLIQRVIGCAKSLVPQLAALMKEAMAKDEAKRKAAAKAAFTWAKTRSGVGKN